MWRKLLIILMLFMLVASVSLVGAQDDDDDALPMFYTSHSGHERLGMVDLDSGAGTDIGAYTHADFEVTRATLIAGSGAIFDGTFYTILNKRLPSGADPEGAEARVARVDMDTGAIEHVGAAINLNLVGLEVSACGEVFATGFTLSNDIGEFFGDTNLYRVDEEDALLTLIGDTGLERIMDLAFDPEGMLWGTVGNVLYTFNMETGEPTTMATITGVEDDLEIMGIAFNSQGELFATSPWLDTLYRLDPMSGEATEVGHHGFEIAHGGDIPMMVDDADCEGDSDED